MDRRTLLALFLTALVIVFTQMLFRGMGAGRKQLPGNAAADSAAAANRAGASASAATAPSVSTPPETVPNAAPIAPPSTVRHQADTTSVDLAKTHYTFSTAGAAPQEVLLTAYRNLGATARTAGKAASLGAARGGPPSPPLLH